MIQRLAMILTNRLSDKLTEVRGYQPFHPAQIVPGRRLKRQGSMVARDARKLERSIRTAAYQGLRPFRIRDAIGRQHKTNWNHPLQWPQQFHPERGRRCRGWHPLGEPPDDGNCSRGSHPHHRSPPCGYWAPSTQRADVALPTGRDAARRALAPQGGVSRDCRRKRRSALAYQRQWLRGAFAVG